MEKINKENLLELWELNNRDGLSIYIHSPFCKKRCKYCVYEGSPIDENFDRYYYEYLPSQIDFYTELINKYKIKSWFFGGGTPSLMTEDIMESVFSYMPKKFINEGEKVIELHPESTTLEKIDILGKYNFTTAIVCVQTFNKKTLESQNRDWVPIEKIISIVNRCRENNILIACDLICSLSEDNDFSEIKKDLSIATLMGFDEITVTLNYKKKNDIKYKLRWKEFMHKFVEGSSYAINRNTIESDYLSIYVNEVFRMFRRDKYEEYAKRGFFSFSSNLCFGSLKMFSSDTSLLGIGEYNGRNKTISSINENIDIIEVNNNFIAEYYIVNRYSFWDMARKLIDVLEKAGGEPPKGTSFCIENYPKIYDKNPYFLNTEELNTDKMTIPWRLFPKDTTYSLDFEIDFIEKYFNNLNLSLSADNKNDKWIK